MEAGPRVKCLKCEDIIQSLHRHDFKTCKCKSIAIDGGSDYTKICGDIFDVEFLDKAEEIEEK